MFYKVKVVKFNKVKDVHFNKVSMFYIYIFFLKLKLNKVLTFNKVT